MHISQAGIQRLAEFEGARPVPYQDSAGLWTLGIGHLLTRSEVSSGKIRLSSYGMVQYGREPWPEEWIKCLLHDDLSPVETVLSRHVHVSLTQPQYDALCCWVFNVGVEAFRQSTLLKQLNFWHYDEIPAQMRRWVYASGQRIPGLANRREREIALWNTEAVDASA